MTKRILDVSSLSKQVGLNDGVLVLRPKARKMFEVSLPIIDNPLPDDIVVCDLREIIDCSSSFVDEFILGWQRIIMGIPNTMLILINMSEDVQYTVEAALNQGNQIHKESLSLIAQINDGFTILGNKLENNALQVFRLMANGKHTTVREVADTFNLELNSAGNRLKKLYDAHVVVRAEQSADAGGKFEYYIPLVQ